MNGKTQLQFSFLSHSYPICRRECVRARMHEGVSECVGCVRTNELLLQYALGRCIWVGANDCVEA